ncbi:hypothetical protein ACIOJE_23855 [Kitasatospora sp. NPDC087861]|uniref:hypothetical protein n=1 Tax=Kitasatospora sp. NPDC087861 TaxID=3364070 RepID=UPI003808BD01
MRTMMDRRLAGFFEQYLNIEMAHGYLARLKCTIRGSGWCGDVQQRFERMLTERNMTRGEFCETTWIDFETDEEMYAYLEKVHAFLFLDRGEVPLPPD